MHANEHVETALEMTPEVSLADVIQMPQRELESFYSRNSADLPHLDNGGSGRYDRASLPTPVGSDADTVLSRLKEFASKNRPAWLPQR